MDLTSWTESIYVKMEHSPFNVIHSPFTSLDYYNSIIHFCVWTVWYGMEWCMCVCVMDWNGDMHFNTLNCRLQYLFVVRLEHEYFPDHVFHSRFFFLSRTKRIVYGIYNEIICQIHWTFKNGKIPSDFLSSHKSIASMDAKELPIHNKWKGKAKRLC